MENSKSLILLDSMDNVLIATQTFLRGDTVDISGHRFVLDRRLPLGWKIARQDIICGHKIFKCGIPIGSASRDINMGEVVHVHNIQSDYVPTFTIKTPDNHGEK